MKLTDADRICKIEEAIKLRREADEKILRAEKLMKDAGFTICDGTSIDYFTKDATMHLMNGVNRMAKLLGKKATFRRDFRGEVDKDQKEVCLCGFTFFQMATVKEGKRIFK